MDIERLDATLQGIARRYSDEMSGGALHLLQALPGHIDSLHVAADGVATAHFDKARVSAANGPVSADGLRKRVQSLNEFFTKKAWGAILNSRKHAFELHFDDRLPISEADIRAWAARISDETVVEDYQPPHAYPERCIFISHKWHEVPALRTVFDQFVAELKRQLGNPPHRIEPVAVHCDTTCFRPETERQAQQDAYCRRAPLALVLWSLAYDNSEDCQRELDFFIDKEGKDRPHKHAIALLEHDRSQDVPARLSARNQLFPPKGQNLSLAEFWPKAEPGKRTEYVAMLRDRILSALDVGAPDPTSANIQRANREALQAGEYDVLGHKPEEPEAYYQNQRIELIPALCDWACDTTPGSPRVTVMLGDFGFGKTVSCRLLTHELMARQRRDQAAPLPLYLDLKALQGGIKTHLEQPIEHLLKAMLQQTGEAVAIEGADVIAYVRSNRCLVIFDGFDEIGQHLNEAQQQQIYRKLLDIIPAKVYHRDACQLNGREVAVGENFPSKLLISCRTHFFESLEKESSFICGSERHPLGADQTGDKNVQRYYMAPFSAEAVQRYMQAALGEAEGARAWRLLGEIHDLSELSAHPIMLSLICRHIPELQVLRASGRQVNAATLYRQLFGAIGQRDAEKHLIRLNHKQELLAALALHLWRQGDTSMSFKNLDDWFVAYGNRHPAIKNQMIGLDALQLLMQDLCNASLLVRDHQDRYRFAHTSYLEFFRALGIFERIRRSADEEDFSVLCGGRDLDLGAETLRFLTDWREATEVEERAAFDRQFIRLLECGGAVTGKRLGFSLWRYGQLHGQDFPHSADSDWSGLRFEEAFIPAELSQLDYTRLRLNACHFHQVSFTHLRLSGADFSDSSLSQCYFHHCELADSHWRDTEIRNSGFYPPTLVPSYTATGGSARHLRRHFGHNNWVSSAAFDHNGQRIVSASYDKTIKIWNADNGACIHTLQGHKSRVSSAAFDHSGQRIVSASDDQTIKIWNADNGACIHTLQGHSNDITSAAFDHSGQRIVSASKDQTIKIWNADNGACIHTLQGHNGWVSSAAFDHNGQRIVSASDDQTIKIWNADNGACIHTLQGHSNDITSAAFDHSGQRIVSASLDQTIKIWNADNGACIHTLQGHNSWVSSAAFDHNGQRIVSASYDTTIKIWNADNGACIHTLQGHNSRVSSAAFDHSGQRIVSASLDQTIKIWNADNGACIHTLQGHNSWVSSAAFDHSGQRIVSASDDQTIKIWNADNGACIHTLQGHSNDITSAAFDHSGQRIVSASFDQTIKIWNADNGACIHTLEGHNKRVTSAAFDHSGQRIVSASADQTIKIWNADNGACIHTLQGHSNDITSAAFDHSGQRIVSASFDKTIKIWNADNGACIHTLQGHSNDITSAAFDHSGQRIVSASEDRTIKIWNADNGACIHTLQGHNSWVSSAAFDHNGQRIVSASFDKTIKIWNADNGACIHTLQGHNSWVSSAAFDHSGQRIVSASCDGTIKIWNADNGRCLYTILNTEAGFVIYRDGEDGDRIERAQGDSWRYLYAQDEDGEVHPACHHPDWGRLYAP